MKMRSKIVTCLVLALSISCLATGCKKKAQETETSSKRFVLQRNRQRAKQQRKLQIHPQHLNQKMAVFLSNFRMTPGQ